MENILREKLKAADVVLYKQNHFLTILNNDILLLPAEYKYIQYFSVKMQKVKQKDGRYKLVFIAVPSNQMVSIFNSTFDFNNMDIYVENWYYLMKDLKKINDSNIIGTPKELMFWIDDIVKHRRGVPKMMAETVS